MTMYNPRKYVMEQIESILNQKEVCVKLIIRDDGSSEETYVKEVEKYPEIILLRGRNVGVANNIMALIEFAYNNTDADYYAYSDQDDYWLPDKLIKGIKKLKSMAKDKPLLYYSNLMVADEQLKPLYPLFRKGVVKNTYSQALAQVFCFACTAVFNKKMLAELYSYDIKKMGFDSLIYFISTFYGEAYFDDEPAILYRQHGDNLSGSHYKGIQNLRNRIRQITELFRFHGSRGEYEYNAQYILENMKEHLSLEQIRDLKVIRDYKRNIKHKLSLMFSKTIRAGYQPKDFYRTVRILLNWY